LTSSFQSNRLTNKNNMTKGESLVLAKQIRKLYHTMRQGEGLSLGDSHTIAYMHAKEVAEDCYHLLIMKWRCQRLLDNEVLSEDELELSQMFREGSIDENHQLYLEGDDQFVHTWMKNHNSENR
jgi:hypothetical protein